MNKVLGFTNKAVKQGNSICIRIPNSIVREGKISEGTEIYVELMPQQYYHYDANSAEKLLKISEKIGKLNKFSEEKKRLFIVLNFKFLEKTMKDMKKQKQDQVNFIEEKKKEFGSKLVKEFIEFAQILNREAFIHTEDGALILKEEYR